MNNQRGFVEVTVIGLVVLFIGFVLFLLMGPFAFVGPGTRGVEYVRFATKKKRPGLFGYPRSSHRSA